MTTRRKNRVKRTKTARHATNGPDWRLRAELLADTLMAMISAGMSMHCEKLPVCAGCRADDVLTAMGRFPDLGKESVAWSESRLLQYASQRAKR
jgi:hypothetical protein